MNRTELEKYICDTYGCNPDYPWLKYPNSAVYRHKSNNKWFAVVLDVQMSKLGLDSQEIIDVINLKCDFNLIGSLITQRGFFPAYHMNKANWISAALDGSADDDTIKWLLDMSYDLTKKAKR